MGSNRKAFQRQTRGQCYKETERLEVTEIVQLPSHTQPESSESSWWLEPVSSVWGLTSSPFNSLQEQAILRSSMKGTENDHPM